MHRNKILQRRERAWNLPSEVVVRQVEELQILLLRKASRDGARQLVMRQIKVEQVARSVSQAGWDGP